MASEIKVDTVSEKTSGSGVTIDGLLIKDGGISGDVSLIGTTPTFTIGDAGAEDAALVFDGNAKDFYIALDDSADKLVIGEGSTVGTNSIMTITDDSVTIGDAAAVDTKLVFDGNAQDYYVGLDDSSDSLVVGLGSTLGTTPAITINSSQVATFAQAPVFPDGSIAIDDLNIDAANDIGANIVDGDLFIIDDGADGTNRKTAASRLKTYIGDHTPTFLAYQNGAVNINSASATIINLQTEAHDSDGKFASSRFTPTVAGTYFVSGAVAFFDTDMDVATAFIYFNGAARSKSAFGSSGGIKPVEISRHVSGTFVMDTDDYVELYGYAESSNDGTIAIGHNSTSYQSYLTAFRLA
jgi:hypothetical protein